VPPVARDVEGLGPLLFFDLIRRHASFGEVVEVVTVMAVTVIDPERTWEIPPLSD
jgi:hypothetical protein